MLYVDDVGNPVDIGIVDPQSANTGLQTREQLAYLAQLPLMRDDMTAPSNDPALLISRMQSRPLDPFFHACTTLRHRVQLERVGLERVGLVERVGLERVERGIITNAPPAAVNGSLSYLPTSGPLCSTFTGLPGISRINESMSLFRR